MAESMRQNTNIRINFKLGYLVIKQGIIKWQQSRELRSIGGGGPPTSPMLQHLKNESLDDLYSNSAMSQTTKKKRSLLRNNSFRESLHQGSLDQYKAFEHGQSQPLERQATPHRTPRDEQVGSIWNSKRSGPQVHKENGVWA